MTHTHRHKYNCLTALCLGLPGWAGTRRNLHPLTPTRKKKKNLHRQQRPLCGAHPLYGALSHQGLSDPIKPPYNQSRPDGRVKLLTSALNQLLISMPAVPVTVPTGYSYTEFAAYFINFLHYCAPPSACYDAEKKQRQTHHNLYARLSVPPPPLSPHFYAKCTLCCNSPNLFWLGRDIK